MEKIFKSKVIVFACDTYFSVVIGETNKLWENAKKTAKKISNKKTVENKFVMLIFLQLSCFPQRCGANYVLCI